MSETLEVRSQTPRDEVVEIPYPSSEKIGKRRYNTLQSCETYAYSESLKIGRFLQFIDISQVASAKHRHCLIRLNGRTKIGPQSLKCNLQRRYLSWLTKADIIIGWISILTIRPSSTEDGNQLSCKAATSQNYFCFISHQEISISCVTNAYRDGSKPYRNQDERLTGPILQNSTYPHTAESQAETHREDEKYIQEKARANE